MSCDYTFFLTSGLWATSLCGSVPVQNIENVLLWIIIGQCSELPRVSNLDKWGVSKLAPNMSFPSGIFKEFSNSLEIEYCCCLWKNGGIVIILLHCLRLNSQKESLFGHRSHRNSTGTRLADMFSILEVSLRNRYGEVITQEELCLCINQYILYVVFCVSVVGAGVTVLRVPFLRLKMQVLAS